MVEFQLNRQVHSKKSYKNTIHYVLVGGLFGLCFPVIGTILEVFISGLPLTTDSFARVQADNPLLWIINTAPIFLGFFAGMAGSRQDQLLQQYSRLEIENSAREKAFEELENLKFSLNQEVNNRTLALETSTEVSRRLSTILDQDELVREVVEQVQTAFDYYHAHIYLFDESKEFLIMVGGTGSAGKTMLEEGHSVTKRRGLVGRAGDTNLPILVPDVTQAAGWLPNPLLPETRAEAAIPIAIGDNVIGVLDVQENKVNGLTEADVELLQSIANQIAVALKNAKAYHRSQKQVEREALMTSINQQIQGTSDMDEALQVAVRELGRALGTATKISLATGKSSNGNDHLIGKLPKKLKF